MSNLLLRSGSCRYRRNSPFSLTHRMAGSCHSNDASAKVRLLLGSESFDKARISSFVASSMPMVKNPTATGRRTIYNATFTPLIVKEDRQNRVVDLRSDTVTAPSRNMLQTALSAQTGDDVMGEDPTVIELELYVADLLGKTHPHGGGGGLFVPTCTMANLLAILSHCHTRAAELVVGAQAHISLWEGGNAANLGGVYSRQLVEDEATAQMPLDAIRDAIRRDDSDDHWAHTRLVCLETTHNMLGGVPVAVDYIQAVTDLCHGSNATTKTSNDSAGNSATANSTVANAPVAVHMDGARLWNAAHALDTTVAHMVESVDSIAVCLSKGLGAPLGSVLVSDNAEFLRLARRARKRCGGGMRQAGVVAAMGLYAVQHNYERLVEDHVRAQRLAQHLQQHGFDLPFRNGRVDTNMFYFGLPTNSKVSRQEFCARLQAEHGVKLTGGYSRGGELFRAVTHLDVNDADIEHAANAIVKLCCP